MDSSIPEVRAWENIGRETSGVKVTISSNQKAADIKEREILIKRLETDACDLVVTNIIEGKIEITGWDKPQTQITALKQSDDVEIEIGQDGRQVPGFC